MLASNIIDASNVMLLNVDTNCSFNCPSNETDSAYNQNNLSKYRYFVCIIWKKKQLRINEDFYLALYVQNYLRLILFNN